MTHSFRNAWIALACHQLGSYRLASSVMQRNLETCWDWVPPVAADAQPPHPEPTLNPMEFHGKRSAQRSLRSHSTDEGATGAHRQLA